MSVNNFFVLRIFLKFRLKAYFGEILGLGLTLSESSPSVANCHDKACKINFFVQGSARY